MVGLDSVEEAQQVRRRLEIAQLAAALPTWGKNPKNEATLKRLEEPITMSFPQETPLKDVLKYIQGALAKSGGQPIPIYLDPLGLQQMERTIDSTVTIDLEALPSRRPCD